MYILVRVKDNVKAGTSILTSVYSYYEMLDENGKKVSDESGSYDIFTVSDKSFTSSLFGNNNSSAATSTTGYTGGVIGFIFKWIIIFLLVALLFLTGRFLYKAIRH
jgi:tetrahydromethanopterin S-methyltransferase subunit F